MPRDLNVTEDPKTKSEEELVSDTGNTFIDPDEVDIFGDADHIDLKKHESLKPKEPTPLGATKEEIEELQNAETDEEDVDDESIEPDEEVETEDDSDEDESEETESDEITDDVPEEFELSEDEYNALKQQDKDELIARILKHKKGSSTLQSKLAKVENALSKELVDGLIEKTTDPRVVRKLITDLSGSKEFQDYVGDFYNKYEFVDGKYTKVDTGPDLETLDSFSKLLVEKMSLDINNFMPEGETFNPGEAYLAGSPSYKARAKYDDAIKKIDDNIDKMTSRAVDMSEKRKSAQAAARAAAESKLNEIISENKIFASDPGAETNFRSFIERNNSDLVSVFFKAWQFERTRGTKLKKLVLNEKKTVSKNNGKVKIKPGKVSTRPEKSTRKVFQEDEMFGDLD